MPDAPPAVSEVDEPLHIVEEPAVTEVGFAGAEGPKFAVIFMFEFNATVNGFVDPEASPDQFTKDPPLFGVAVRVTFVPVAKSAVFIEEPVFMPDGELTTFPLYPSDAVVATVRLDAFTPPLIVALKSRVFP